MYYIWINRFSAEHVEQLPLSLPSAPPNHLSNAQEGHEDEGVLAGPRKERRSCELSCARSRSRGRAHLVTVITSILVPTSRLSMDKLAICE
jgi:hypothetical protein